MNVLIKCHGDLHIRFSFFFNASGNVGLALVLEEEDHHSH